MKQLVLPGMVGRGGKRQRAGRGIRGDRRRTSHEKRPRVSRHTPMMVTFRVRDEIPCLRNREVLAMFEGVLEAMRRREGFRVIHFTLLSNHVPKGS